MFEDKDMYGVLVGTVGERPARAGLVIVFVAAVCGGLGVIGTFVYYTNDKVIRPLVQSIPVVPAEGTIAQAAVSFGISGLMLAGVGYVAARHLRTRESRLVRSIIDKYLMPMLTTIGTRLDGIEASGRERAATLDDRLKALEDHTITPLEKQFADLAYRQAQNKQLTPVAERVSTPPEPEGTEVVSAADQRLSVAWKPHTSGLSVVVTNLNAKEIFHPSLQIADARRWSDSATDYVKAQEIEVIESLDHPTLYCDQPADFRCFYLGGGKLRMDGYKPKQPGAITHLDLRGAGQWRIDLKIKWGEEGRFDVSLFFKWDGRNVPEPL